MPSLFCIIDTDWSCGIHSHFLLILKIDQSAVGLLNDTRYPLGHTLQFLLVPSETGYQDRGPDKLLVTGIQIIQKFHGVLLIQNDVRR